MKKMPREDREQIRKLIAKLERVPYEQWERDEYGQDLTTKFREQEVVIINCVVPGVGYGGIGSVVAIKIDGMLVYEDTYLIALPFSQTRRLLRLFNRVMSHFDNIERQREIDLIDRITRQ